MKGSGGERRWLIERNCRLSGRQLLMQIRAQPIEWFISSKILYEDLLRIWMIFLLLIHETKFKNDWWKEKLGMNFYIILYYYFYSLISNLEFVMLDTQTRAVEGLGIDRFFDWIQLFNYTIIRYSIWNFISG